jgi:hypothetical protein
MTIGRRASPLARNAHRWQVEFDHIVLIANDFHEARWTESLALGNRRTHFTVKANVGNAQNRRAISDVVLMLVFVIQDTRRRQVIGTAPFCWLDAMVERASTNMVDPSS